MPKKTSIELTSQIALEMVQSKFKDQSLDSFDNKSNFQLSMNSTDEKNPANIVKFTPSKQPVIKSNQNRKKIL